MARTLISGPAESAIEQWVVRQAKEQFGVIGLKLSIEGSVGWPDRMFLIPGGRPLLIEFKRPGEEPRPIQRHRIKILEQLGYDVEVHDDKHEALDAIRRKVEAT